MNEVSSVIVWLIVLVFVGLGVFVIGLLEMASTSRGDYGYNTAPFIALIGFVMILVGAGSLFIF